MSTAFAKWATSIFALLYMTTPLLAYADSANNTIVETVLQEHLKEAAIVGYFSPEIIKSMKDELELEHNFDRDTIEFTGTTSPTSRGNYIEGELKVPRGPIVIFKDLFSPGQEYIHKKRRILSEAIF